MSNLPQLHDWFTGLLTTNQWVFVWFIAGAIVLGLVIWAIADFGVDTSDQDEIAGAVCSVLFFPFLVPFMVWGTIVVILHFLSFMIYLLNT